MVSFAKKVSVYNLNFKKMNFQNIFKKWNSWPSWSTSLAIIVGFFSKFTYGPSESIDLSMYFQLLKLFQDYELQALLQPIFDYLLLTKLYNDSLGSWNTWLHL